MTKTNIRIPFTIVFDIGGDTALMNGVWEGVDSSRMYYDIKTVDDDNEDVCFDQDFIDLAKCADNFEKCKNSKRDSEKELYEEHSLTNSLHRQISSRDDNIKSLEETLCSVRTKMNDLSPPLIIMSEQHEKLHYVLRKDGVRENIAIETPMLRGENSNSYLYGSISTVMHNQAYIFGGFGQNEKRVRS